MLNTFFFKSGNERVFSELVHEELLNNTIGIERTEPSVLDDILNTADVDIRDKIVTLIDLVSGGIETVLYNIL